ncbi:hypothetical protein AGR56_06780 [Clostridium sp. DMHC 10]|nr:hypothetical protein AGR56_06780 [Clostridium sp. DMHC 10]
MNSRWYNTHKSFKEPLQDRDWIVNFCSQWEIPISSVISKKMIDTLLELRNFLSDLIEGISSQNTIGSEDINKINKYLMPFLFYRTLKSDGKKYYIEDAIYGKSNNFIVFEVVSSFIEMISKYDIKRMKLCQNPECKWAFYDESKNCTRKWCDNTCATLMKVRKFRQNKSKINKDKTQ